MPVLRSLGLLPLRLALQLLQMIFGLIANIGHAIYKGFGNMEDSVIGTLSKITSGERSAAKRGRVKDSVLRDIERL